MRQLIFSLVLIFTGINSVWAAEVEIARAIFTTGISEREPLDNEEQFTTDTQKVFFFTDLRNFEGKTVTHKWMFNGQEMASVPFNVGGPRWRVYSSKTMLPSWVGTWTVEVLAEDGITYGEFEFDYIELASE